MQHASYPDSTLLFAKATIAFPAQIPCQHAQGAVRSPLRLPTPWMHVILRTNLYYSTTTVILIPDTRNRVDRSLLENENLTGDSRLNCFEKRT